MKQCLTTSLLAVSSGVLAQFSFVPLADFDISDNNSDRSNLQTRYTNLKSRQYQRPYGSYGLTPPPADLAAGPYYWGPDYPFPGFDAVDLLPGSDTFDTGRGNMIIQWTDWYNVQHKIDFSSNHDALERVVFFPIMGPSWNWHDGDDWQRTGFNEACKWVQAKFHPQRGDWLRDDSVRVEAQCYKYVGEPLGQTAIGEVKEAFADIATIATDVANVVQSGVNIVDNVMLVISKIEASAAVAE